MKTNLIGRLVALGVITSTIAGFGVKSYDTATSGSLSNKINELKQLAISWKNNSTAKDELLNQKEQELSALQGKYESILTLLGIENMDADENTIKEAINSLSSENDLKDIATALGIDSNASKEDILNEISVMGETMVTLKDSIDTLESTVGQLTAEIERLQGEVDSANAAEATMLEELMVTIEDIGTPVIEEPGEEPGTTYCSTHTGIELVDGACSTCVNLATLEETMTNAWEAVVAELPSSAKNETDYGHIKSGNYKIDSMYTLRVNGTSKGTVDKALDDLIKAYLTAKTNYLNAGGTLE